MPFFSPFFAFLFSFICFFCFVCLIFLLLFLPLLFFVQEKQTLIYIKLRIPVPTVFLIFCLATRKM